MDKKRDSKQRRTEDKRYNEDRDEKKRKYSENNDYYHSHHRKTEYRSHKRYSGRDDHYPDTDKDDHKSKTHTNSYRSENHYAERDTKHRKSKGHHHDDHHHHHEHHKSDNSFKTNVWSPYAKVYDPLKSGSIDGTDTYPHDKAVSRAIEARYDTPRGLKSDPDKTLFVARFGEEITEKHLEDFFNQYGEIVSVKVIYDIVTGHSMRYGFVEMKDREDAWRLARKHHNFWLENYRLFVDLEVGRTMEGWKPRRLGGGFGGKKESGQLRFGGKDRPFKAPISLDQVS